MPYGTEYDNPVFSDEEAWDVAAYVNSLPRPHRKFAEDWPDISKKPLIGRSGLMQIRSLRRKHKYGPFAVFRDWRASQEPSTL